jgi:hypothetical protein
MDGRAQAPLDGAADGVLGVEGVEDGAEEGAEEESEPPDASDDPPDSPDLDAARESVR